MGQKVNPYVLRLGIIRTWQSNWFARGKDYSRFIQEDSRIRKLIKSKYKQAAISKIIIERLTERIKIRILTARPGIIIGRHGADIERLREELNALAKKEVSIDIEEVKIAALDAQLVAENISMQIEKRVAFRRAMKRAIEQSMTSGAKGIKACVSGRLDGAEMCRTETYKLGKIPLQTLRADIDYGFTEAFTTYGIIGIKTWIYKGEILPKKILPRQAVQEKVVPEA